MTSQFAGESVLITGAAGGIGRELARSFAESGANVLMCDVDESAVASAADMVSASAKGRVVPQRLDVSIEAQFEAAVERAVAEFTTLDHLVNNAGVVHVATIVTTPEEAWDRVMNVNLKGSFFGVKTALPVMLDQGHGTITNVSSGVGKRGSAMLSAYCASKAAVISLTQTAALEAAPNVRVNCVCPGVLDTQMQEQEYEIMARTTGKDRDAVRQEWVESIPLLALQRPQDIADGVMVLASRAASQLTGESLSVNGGWLMD